MAEEVEQQLTEDEALDKAFAEEPDEKDGKKTQEDPEDPGNQETEEEPEETATETEESNESTETEEDDILKDFPIEEDEFSDKDAPEPVSLVLKQIKAKTGGVEILKEFPIVKAALFKNQEYSEIFPEVKDAKEAIEKIEVYTMFDNEISRGNLAPIISTLKRSNPAAIAKIAEDFIETLGDTKLANITAEPIVRAHLKAMLTDAQTSKNRNLELAARYTIRYLYGSDELPTGKIKANAEEKPEVSAELKALRAERAQLTQRELHSLRQGIIDQFENKLLDFVEKHIDPEKQMLEFTRKAAARHVQEQLQDKLSSNPAHIKRLAGLWQQLNASNASEVGPRIIRAFLGSAKPYLSELIAKTRSEALGTKGKKPSSTASNTAITGGGGGGPKAGNSLKGLSGKIDYKKTSEDDILDAAFSGDVKKIKLRNSA